MQTNFSLEQLASDPELRSSAEILRTCVHCGFCTATCPTYLLLGDELDSPRGRIYMIKDMLENGKPATREVVKHVDRCLSCLSCMTTCPSGVNYMHLIDHARSHIERTYDRSLSDRLIRLFLAAVLPYPRRFWIVTLAAGQFKRFGSVIGALPIVGARLQSMLELAPLGALPPPKLRPRVFKAQGQRRGRVALLRGCAQAVLNPAINEATIRVLTRCGIEVVETKGEKCCGAIVHHMGRTEESHSFVKANIDAWIVEADGKGLDAIVITASGCGTTIKDYGFMLRNDRNYAQKSARVSSLAMDVTEYLERLDLRPVRKRGLRVSYHSACSMQHGQNLIEGPKRILDKVGFDVVDVPEGHICCGSAGAYNILQPEIAARLRERKTLNLLKTKPYLVATGNIGCMLQIERGLAAAGAATPIVHTVQLVDWATGGPAPGTLAKLFASVTTEALELERLRSSTEEVREC